MPVEFPKTLNMKRYLNHECMQVPDYDLVSIVRHHGETVEAGHYICDRASNNVETSEQGYDCKSWQRCNDSVVTDISEVSLSMYLLMLLIHFACVLGSRFSRERHAIYTVLQLQK